MFGQHSYEGGHTYRKDELLPLDAIDGRKAGHNRVTFTYPDGSRVYRLYRTDVVTLFSNGELILDDGGYPTMTTRRAMMQGIELLTGRKCYVWGNGSYGHEVHVDRGAGGVFEFYGSVHLDKNLRP